MCKTELTESFSRWKIEQWFAKYSRNELQTKIMSCTNNGTEDLSIECCVCVRLLGLG